MRVGILEIPNATVLLKSRKLEAKCKEKKLKCKLKSDNFVYYQAMILMKLFESLNQFGGFQIFLAVLKLSKPIPHRNLCQFQNKELMKRDTFSNSKVANIFRICKSLLV